MLSLRGEEKGSLNRRKGVKLFSTTMGGGRKNSLSSVSAPPGEERGRDAMPLYLLKGKRKEKEGGNEEDILFP